MGQALEIWSEIDVAGDGEDEGPPLSDPALLPPVFVTGERVSRRNGLVAIDEWATLGSGTDTEHRIVNRTIRTIEAARRLRDKLNAILPKS